MKQILLNIFLFAIFLIPSGSQALDLQIKVLPEALYPTDEIWIQIMSKQKIKKVSASIDNKLYALEETMSSWQIKVPFTKKSKKEIQVKLFIKDDQDAVVELNKTIPVIDLSIKK